MNFFGYYVLNLRPTILSFIGSMYSAPDWLKADALIEHVPWWHGRTYSMLRRKYQQRQYERMGIDHSLMVHAKDEEAKRSILKVKGAFISQNIYIDKNIFVPRHGEKPHKAIYVAQLRPFKRHHLARDIDSLFLVAADLEERERYKSIVPGASFNDRRLSKSEMADAVNSASCSLALSRIEGGMLASFESLLCGVPVVTTESKGGRDLFLDTYNSVTVEPNPKAVREGVECFQAHQPDPLAIRARALKELEPHKLRFCKYVSDKAIALGGARVDPCERYQRYFGGRGGLSDHFIWADKFQNAAEVERIQKIAFVG